jgi:hypothetical protein
LNSSASSHSKLLSWFAALAAILAVARPAAAFDSDFGGSDFHVRWDNTLRGNMGIRTTSPDATIGGNPAFTAGEYSFAQGGLTTSRLDILSEFDAAYAEQFGFRTSFAGWYDAAYQDHKIQISPTLAAGGVPTGYANGGFSDYLLHYYRGPWGEFLDAFGWGRFDAGGIPITVKVGRHSIYWGESLLLGGAIHGVAYSQVPLDLIKGFANPGVEAKELYRPLTQVSGNAQVTSNLSLSAQYVWEWASYLYPEGGTFTGPADFAFNGPEGQFAKIGTANTYFKNGGSNDSRHHDWGLAMRYKPEVIDGTFGLYYRRYTDKLAAVLIVPNAGAVGPLSPGLNSPFQYQQFYAEGIDLIGASYAREIAGVSASVEANFRHNTPLLAQTLGFATAAGPLAAFAPVLFPHGAPQLLGNSYQARGDTFHAVANMLGTFGPSPLWSTVAWNIEGTYSRLVTVTDNQDMYFGQGYGVCSGNPKLGTLAKTWRDGCATDNQAGVAASFTPTWYQVFSGVDLLLPLTGSANFWGNSPVTLGGNAGSGTYSAGVGADIRQRLRLDVKYIGFYGTTIADSTGKLIDSNGLISLLKNRESVVFTAKATF